MTMTRLGSKGMQGRDFVHRKCEGTKTGLALFVWGKGCAEFERNKKSSATFLYVET